MIVSANSFMLSLPCSQSDILFIKPQDQVVNWTFRSCYLKTKLLTEWSVHVTSIMRLTPCFVHVTSSMVLTAHFVRTISTKRFIALFIDATSTTLLTVRFLYAIC